MRVGVHTLEIGCACACSAVDGTQGIGATDQTNGIAAFVLPVGDHDPGLGQRPEAVDAEAAGVGFQETSPDKDVLAVDGAVDFAIASVRVQVKCTGQFRLKGGSTATWPIYESWRKHWQRSGVSVYFVLVIVDPDEQLSWLHHHDDATLHRAAAFWVRVDTLQDGQNIVVPKTQRLTADTLQWWLKAVEASFTGSRGDGADV
ncbi:DUF4365 domain-containing protein [Nocardia sp. NPDC050630]|uniref:DUF4365 domain-containing protein n=1 Tax=Nocardia sp. NPDC050630 TaxID=3364321 RepID=UPI0037AB1A43